ncbi:MULTISPECIES: gamma-glutamylcyclotransferase family protein [Vibrio]|uniref:Gamma-glutamylcyclotransferase n=1 Tax=Vibrio ostreae TaxID=2841925 RepID=A0A975U7Z5_9VIBR|nr:MULTISPECIES: gamma-glutamylcyclotransferase family protein [Vibrio]QXO16840.1 gamma-glutamylcyclotransferase [Vibrio ostreae]WGY46154.1 gamma-glutamylcyclotransferase [Vibrio sp. ABG19]
MYIFGYGSLMNSASRQLTGNTGQALPAIVHGLVRHWGKIDDSYVISPLVVNPGQGEVNGVLLEIDDAALVEFDRRERGYQRIALSAEQIETDHAFDRTQPIWVYIKDDHQPPCANSPIVQTYVDTVLAGCLEVSENFARHFVEHTLGWHHPLENDRHAPKYGNLAGVKQDHHPLIDALLADVR